MIFYRVVYLDSENKHKKASELINFLNSCGYKYSEEKFEYLFVVGGDGSFIHFVKEFSVVENKKPIKIIGIPSGFVSFLPYIHGISNDSFTLFQKTEINKQLFKPLYLLEIECDEGVFYAANDFYVSGDLMLKIDLFINDVFFQKYRGSGLLFSTQLGSTGKNKSLNGPVIFPTINAWLINFVGAQSVSGCRFFNNPVILSDRDEIKLSNFEACKFYLDGKSFEFSDRQKLKTISIKMKKTPNLILDISVSEYVYKFKKKFLSL